MIPSLSQIGSYDGSVKSGAWVSIFTNDSSIKQDSQDIECILKKLKVQKGLDILYNF